MLDGSNPGFLIPCGRSGRRGNRHPTQGKLRALRRLQRESQSSPFLFVSERGSPFTTAGLARMIE
jgi:hypothetical protein